MNGVKESAYLHFLSSRLNVKTLRFALTSAMTNRTDTSINIFEIKMTPNMKHCAYSVYVIFILDEVTCLVFQM